MGGPHSCQKSFITDRKKVSVVCEAVFEYSSIQRDGLLCDFGLFVVTLFIFSCRNIESFCISSVIFSLFVVFLHLFCVIFSFLSCFTENLCGFSAF